MQELESYNWDQEKNDTGLVRKEEFLEFLEYGKPRNWCGGATGVTEVDNNTMKNICRGIYGLLNPNEYYYTQVTWKEPIKNGIGEQYIEDFLTALRSYGENVRIVFWFDN